MKRKRKELSIPDFILKKLQQKKEHQQRKNKRQDKKSWVNS